jgi:hypothetical protein
MGYGALFGLFLTVISGGYVWRLAAIRDRQCAKCDGALAE